VNKIDQMKDEQLKKAQDDIRFFFNLIVPAHLQKGFKAISLKHYKQLAEDVYLQKEALDISNRGVSRCVFNAKLGKYIEDSKKLMRLVMYKEFNIPVDEKKTATDPNESTSSIDT